jgi:hypothetical protein
LIAEDDIGQQKFLQDYVNSMLSFKHAGNHELRQKVEIYLLPSGHNSLSEYIAAHEPLYRQNVF